MMQNKKAGKRMIIGLTGGSGTGKSTACEYFKENGFVIIDSDKIAREVTSKGEKCLEEIRLSFGNGVIDAEGNLIRPHLAKIVFNDPEKLKLLNCITFKYIVGRNKEIIDENPQKNIVLDAPLLFEAGLDSLCTETIGVLSTRENRIARIMERDSVSKEVAVSRISSQPDDEFYISRSDYILCNNGKKEDFVLELKKLFGGIR